MVRPHPRLSQQLPPHDLRRTECHLLSVATAPAAASTQAVLARVAVRLLLAIGTSLPPASSPEETRQESASSVERHGIGCVGQRRALVLAFDLPVVAPATDAPVEVGGLVVLALTRGVGVCTASGRNNGGSGGEDGRFGEGDGGGGGWSGNLGSER